MVFLSRNSTLWFQIITFMIIIQVSTEKINNIALKSISPTWKEYISKHLNTNEEELTLNYNYISNDITIIMNRFDKVEYDFENWLKMMDSEQRRHLIRETREVSRINQNECTVSKDKLIKVKNEIQNILELRKTSLAQTNCNLNLTIIDCSELIKLMECGLANMKSQLQQITSNDVKSNDVIKWKTNFDKMNKYYIKLEDDLIKKYDRKYKNQIDLLNTDLHNLKVSIDKLENKLKDANENIKQTTIKYCASEIHSKKLTDCLKDFNNLRTKIPDVNYTDVVSNIIQKSLNYIVNDNEMVIINFIVEFISKLNRELEIAASDKLYKEMEIRYYLNSPYVLTFDSKIKNKNNYTAVKLKTATELFLFKWGQQIIAKNDWQILVYARNQKDSFYYFLKSLVSNAYSKNIYNSEKVIKFLDRLPFFEQKALGYHTLYENIKLNHGINGHEVIMLIYRMKEIVNNNMLSQLDHNLKQNLLNLIKELPSGIKALLWDNYVFVKSKYYNYYLVSLHRYFGVIYINTILAICPSFVSSTTNKWAAVAYEKGRYFKIKNMANGHNIEYYWTISSDDNGKGFYFTNRKNNNRLYTTGAIGGWLAFWYSVPKNCYQVYDNEYKSNFQRWLIS